MEISLAERSPQNKRMAELKQAIKMFSLSYFVKFDLYIKVYYVTIKYVLCPSL